MLKKKRIVVKASGKKEPRRKNEGFPLERVGSSGMLTTKKKRREGS